jgi:hypothetical protein
VLAGVRLNVPADTSLLTLEAVDIDSDSLPMTYRLVNSTFFSLAPSIIDTVPVPANHSTVFRLDNETGELRTASGMVAFVDGFFELQVTANNTEVVGREVNTTIKVWSVLTVYLFFQTRELFHSGYAYPFTLKMEALCSFETSVDIHQTIQCCKTHNFQQLFIFPQITVESSARFHVLQFCVPR